jgi:hypothetical protein
VSDIIWGARVGPENRTPRWRLYSGSCRARLWRRVAAAAALFAAIGCGGCSISSPAFDSLFGGSDNDHTASITPPPGAKETADLPPEHDLAYARAAASHVLTRGVKDSSEPWENPQTGARGTVTPIASAYTQDGETCRDFLASYITSSSQAWLQGEACKPQQGAWEIRSLRPWKRS